jgi:hypothetical protein
MPNGAQHECHQNREKVVEEYHKEVNDALDYLSSKESETKSYNSLSFNM